MYIKKSQTVIEDGKFMRKILLTSKLNQKDQVMQNKNPITGKETVIHANCCRSIGILWRVR